MMTIWHLSLASMIISKVIREFYTYFYISSDTENIRDVFDRMDYAVLRPSFAYEQSLLSCEHDSGESFANDPFMSNASLW